MPGKKRKSSGGDGGGGISSSSGVINLVFIGNPGAGKSTLLNSLIGKVVFKSGVSAATGITSVVESCLVGIIRYIDTPGLNDVYTRQQAANEIEKALKMGGRYLLVFLLTQIQGRIQISELATMQFVLESLDLPSKPKFIVVVNQVGPGVAKLIDTNDEFAEKFYSPLYSLKWKPLDTIYLPRFLELDENTDMLVPPPQLLLSLVLCVRELKMNDIIEPGRVKSMRIFKHTIDAIKKVVDRDCDVRNGILRGTKRKQIISQINRGATKYRLKPGSKVHCRQCPYIRRKTVESVRTWTETDLCAICFDCRGEQEFTEPCSC